MVILTTQWQKTFQNYQAPRSRPGTWRGANKCQRKHGKSKVWHLSLHLPLLTMILHELLIFPAAAAVKKMTISGTLL